MVYPMNLDHSTGTAKEQTGDRRVDKMLILLATLP
jgi:hypothetical protein